MPAGDPREIQRRRTHKSGKTWCQETPAVFPLWLELLSVNQKNESPERFSVCKCTDFRRLSVLSCEGLSFLFYFFSCGFWTVGRKGKQWLRLHTRLRVLFNTACCFRLPVHLIRRAVGHAQKRWIRQAFLFLKDHLISGMSLISSLKMGIFSGETNVGWDLCQDWGRAWKRTQPESIQVNSFTWHKFPFHGFKLFLYNQLKFLLVCASLLRPRCLWAFLLCFRNNKKMLSGNMIICFSVFWDFMD